MGVFVRPNSPYFWLRLPRRGQAPLRESTGIPVSGGAASRALAEAAYHARMGDLARGRYELPGAPEPVTPSVSFADWADWYAKHVLPTHRGQEREAEILAVLRAAFGHLTLTRITRTVVQEWTTARVSPTVSPRTVNREADLLKAMLRSAVEHHKLDASPLAGMKRLHVTTPERRLMTLPEERALLKVLEPADKALLLMSLDTLCRLGDCLDLRWQDDRGKTLWIADPKVGGGYAVPVSSRLRTALDALPRTGEYVFAARRRFPTDARRRRGVAQMLEAACLRAGLPAGRAAHGLTWHWATRRTAATRLIQAGEDLATVQALGHWRDPSIVLGIYSEADPRQVAAAAERIGKPVRRIRRWPGTERTHLSRRSR